MLEKNVARNTLLETKFYAPLYPARWIVREGLVERLLEGMRSRLVLVCAPAGFGKTTLLCEALVAFNEGQASTKAITAWLTLDREDNDPARFWRYIEAVLENAGLPGISTFHPQLGTDARPALTTLLNAVRRCQREVILLLDDYHLIETPTIHEAIAFVLEHAPTNFHLLLATRTQPPFPLARLRAYQQLVELRADDLRFTLVEATQFLRAEVGSALQVEDVIALEQRTEGWIAGLQIAALSLRDRQDPSTFIESFTGSHRYIFDYLVEEVLARLPEDIQAFLLATSLLDSLCAPLCNVLTERTNSQEMLTYLEQANVFLVPLDDERRWYRYHRLFADVLLQLLQQRQPELVPVLHRRASLWYEQHGRLAEAVEHRLAVDDHAYASELILQEGNTLLRRGEMVVLYRWLKRLPEDLLRANPRLFMAYIWSLLGAGRWHEVAARLHEVEHLVSDAENKEHFASMGSQILAVRAALAGIQGDSAGSIELSQRSLEGIAPHDFTQRAYVTLYMAMSYWARSEWVVARQSLQDASYLGRISEHHFVHITALCLLANIETLFGNFQLAYNYYQQALDLTRRHLSVESPATGLTHFYMALMFYERNELDKALEHFEISMRFVPASDAIRDQAAGVLAMIKYAMGERDAAYAALRELENRIASNDNQQSAMITYCAGCYLSLGDEEKANALLERYQLKDFPLFWNSFSYLLEVRLWLYRHEPEKVIPYVQPLLANAEEQGLRWMACKIYVLLALAQHMQGDREQALTSLARALSLAEAAGFFRSLLNEGGQLNLMLADLLTTLAERTDEGYSPRYVQVLLTTLKTELAQAQVGSRYLLTGSGAQNLAEPLSARELEILRLITTGMSNQEILDHLLIAKSTLKTHINHIYSKLSVSNRTQAIVKARQLTILQ